VNINEEATTSSLLGRGDSVWSSSEPSGSSRGDTSETSESDESSAECENSEVEAPLVPAVPSTSTTSGRIPGVRAKRIKANELPLNLLQAQLFFSRKRRRRKKRF